MISKPLWGIRVLGLAGVLAISLAATGASAVSNCFGREPTWIGTAGPDTYHGNAGTDVLSGVGGNDALYGEGGNDFICGGEGNDTITGGRGNDRLSGEAGADLLLGSPGDDRLLGGPGNDTLKGQAGDDSLDGGSETDTVNGGPGSDSCFGENRASCEIFPPTGCSNPARVPGTPLAANVTVVGSNAFHTHSSFGLCTGGVCDYDYLEFVVELRNDGAAWVNLNRATINIYDGSGGLIGKRFASAEAGALGPGERTVLTEKTPSFIYDPGEFNHYPWGWASWDLVMNATLEAPSTYDDLVMAASGLAIPPKGSLGLKATGTATNTLGKDIHDVSWWVALYDSAGRLINVATAFDFVYPEAVPPGGEVSFEVTFSGPICYASARSGASGGE